MLDLKKANKIVEYLLEKAFYEAALASFPEEAEGLKEEAKGRFYSLKRDIESYLSDLSPRFRVLHDGLSREFPYLYFDQEGRLSEYGSPFPSQESHCSDCFEKADALGEGLCHLMEKVEAGEKLSHEELSAYGAYWNSFRDLYFSLPRFARETLEGKIASKQEEIKRKQSRMEERRSLLDEDIDESSFAKLLRETAEINGSYQSLIKRLSLENKGEAYSRCFPVALLREEVPEPLKAYAGSKFGMREGELSTTSISLEAKNGSNFAFFELDKDYDEYEGERFYRQLEGMYYCATLQFAPGEIQFAFAEPDFPTPQRLESVCKSLSDLSRDLLFPGHALSESEEELLACLKALSKEVSKRESDFLSSHVYGGLSEYNAKTPNRPILI